MNRSRKETTNIEATKNQGMVQMKKLLFIATVLLTCHAMAKQEFLIKVKAGVALEDLQAAYGEENVEDLQFNNWVKVVVQDERSFHADVGIFATMVEKNSKIKYTLYRPEEFNNGSQGKGAVREGEDLGGLIGGGLIGGGDGGGDGGGGDMGGLIGGGLIGGGDGGGGDMGGLIGGGLIGGGDAGGNGGDMGGFIGGMSSGGGGASKDPDFPTSFAGGSGDDTDYGKQWGMADNGVKEAWKVTKGAADMVVAVIDTGVDYTHDDIAANVWRNPGETGTDASGKDKSRNGVDDDNNGFVDDVVGWDFAKNDNKPYDTVGGFMGNPGHGTHCAGNIAAVSENGRGIIGIAPNVKIMALRFLDEKGAGDMANGIKAIKYAVDNGAKVLSNSWGSEGDGGEGAPLKEAIQYAMDNGVLFVAAAGNGHQGVGYNNDTDAKPAYPASYDHDNIVSVAALDKSNNKTSFSNWGVKTVDLGAPGGGVYSSIPSNKFMNMDGTSMACPHVAGAAALYWSRNPSSTWQDVKAALMNTGTPVSSMKGKTVSGNKLNVKNLVK